MKQNNKVKEVNRQDTCQVGDISQSIQVVVQNGKGKVSLRPSIEIVGLKYGERVKTRTITRKIVLNKKSNSDNKRNVKKK